MRRSILILAILLFVSPAAHAQQSAAGGSYSLLSLSYPDQMPNGFGGWYSWDLSSDTGMTVGLDFGANVFPEDHPIIGRQTQLFGGLRGGVRSERFGAFGRLRPGLMHFSRQFLAPDRPCILIFPTPEACLTENSNFAVDAGGTLEIYLAAPMLVRLDLGSTMIRFRRSDEDGIWKRNLQFSAGAGLRF